MEKPKKKYRVIVNGKQHEVEIEKSDLREPLSVTINGESYQVEVEEAEMRPTEPEESVSEPQHKP